MFPVYIYEKGVELPKDGTYYIVAGNGTFLHKDTGLVRCLIPVKEISFLPELDASSWVGLNLPKLPIQLVQKVKQFFAQVVAENHTEASVTLYFNKETQEFKAHVSEQYVSHGGVRYSRKLTEEEAPGYEGFLRIGTIHSHCDFEAFHSGTDINDEEDFDGLHVTFGHNDRKHFTISASIVVNGQRTKVDPQDVLGGIFCVHLETYALAEEEQELYDISSWMNKVHTTPIMKKPITKTRCSVEWAGELKFTGWRQKFGDGPFEVISSEDGYLSIQTKDGLAHFAEALFRKII